MVTTSRRIDTDSFSKSLRERGIERASRKVLITDFTGSEQERDFSEPTNCDGFGRIRHFRRETSPGWPENTLPVLPAARALGLDSWHELLRAQVFQNAVCNWRCWYCFVDFPLLSGNPKHSAWLAADDLIDLYLVQQDRPAVIDLSGGQPDLVPEWVPWMMDELRRRGLSNSVYLWSDDNLSNDYFFTKLTIDERRLVDGYRNYGKVCCFKGFDSRSFAFNTLAAPELFKRQFKVFGRLLRETEIDLYCYVTLTTLTHERIDQQVSRFVDRLQDLHPNLPLRMIPLEIKVFTPVERRLTPEHERALELQHAAVEAWMRELESRFSLEERRRDIAFVPLRS